MAAAPAPRARDQRCWTTSLRRSYNDEKLVERLVPVWQKLLGDDNVVQKDPTMGSEDFSFYQKAGAAVLMFRLGSVEPDAAGRSDPGRDGSPFAAFGRLLSRTPICVDVQRGGDGRGGHGIAPADGQSQVTGGDVVRKAGLEGLAATAADRQDCRHLAAGLGSAGRWRSPR